MQPLIYSEMNPNSGNNSAGSPRKPTAVAPAPQAGAKNMTAPETPLEEKVLASPHLKESIAEAQLGKLPPIYIKFVEEMAPRLEIRTTSSTILQAFANVDVTAQKIAQALRGNPYYQHYFRRTLEAKAKRADPPSLESGVVLLGMQNSRNMILGLQAWRTVRGQNPEMGPSGTPKIEGKDILKIAIKTEDALSNDRSGVANSAFAAGMIYDLLFMLTESMNDGKARAQQLLDETYKHGMKAATIATALSKNLSDFSFRKHIYAACLLHDVGKVAMAILDTAYVDWLESAKKQELPRALRHVSEKLRFGITHADIGGLICQGSPLFRPIAKAIIHHHDPQRMKAYKATYDLACLISLSSNMANQYRKVSVVEDPLLQTWRGPELKEFKLTDKQIVAATLDLAL